MRQYVCASRNHNKGEREGLSMVYAVKKFKHYLLENKFIFFVHHQALQYLVNKPCMMGRITRWLLILMEFDFTIAVKKGRTHVLADHMSRIPNGEKSVGVDDDLPDAPLFLVDLVPEWAEEICHYLTNGLPTDAPIDMSKARRLIRDAAPYQLIADNYTSREKME